MKGLLVDHWVAGTLSVSAYSIFNLVIEKGNTVQLDARFCVNLDL